MLRNNPDTSRNEQRNAGQTVITEHYRNHKTPPAHHKSPATTFGWVGGGGGGRRFFTIDGAANKRMKTSEPPTQRETFEGPPISQNRVAEMETPK